MVLVGSSVTCIAAGLCWSATYLLAGAVIAAAVPAIYAVLSLASTALFALTRSYRIYVALQLTLIFFLPLCMSVILGDQASAVVIWSALAPFGALLFASRRTALVWFALLLLALASTVVPLPEIERPLPHGFVTAMFVLNIGALLALLFAMTAYFIRQMHLLQDRSEMLLHSILPKHIAEHLKGSPSRTAKQHDEASILFADIVGFTALSSQLSPDELVTMLDEVFVEFDLLVDQLGLEKIKTIGDCYMVASGIPLPRADHAHVLAQLALAMQRTVANRLFCGQRLAFRIGMNSGPVVAGVIGRKKFIYDLWGEAVNIASRVEGGGTGGAIQISAATHALLKGDFVCVPAGKVRITGEHEVEVYHLIGEKRSLPDFIGESSKAGRQQFADGRLLP
ncbi:MAG TPA: adenylate/guanylate cyclase domain-containing protein [Hyphomicrobiaceae bacterium]